MLNKEILTLKCYVIYSQFHSHSFKYRMKCLNKLFVGNLYTKNYEVKALEIYSYINLVELPIS